MRLLSPCLLLLAVPAFADIVFLKNGMRFEGSVAQDGANAVISTADVAQAQTIDTKKGWQVQVQDGSAQITLPTSEIEAVLDPSRDATPLVRALEHSDKRVRYAAALALARIAPKQPFVGSEQVVSHLAQAVGEAGIRVVLVVTDDPDLSNRLASQVRDAQYIAVQSESVVDCLGRIKRSPGKDLILLDGALGRTDLPKEAEARSEQTRALVRRIDDITHYKAGDSELPVEMRYARDLFLKLREDYRARGIPIVVLGGEGELEQLQKIYADQRVAAFLPKQVDAKRLGEALGEVFKRDDPSLMDSKDLADAAALSACRGLKGIPRNDAVLRPQDAEEALLRAFSEAPTPMGPRRTTPIRTAALEAAGAVGGTGCYRGALAVLLNVENPPELRHAAAQAIADIAEATAAGCPADIAEGLRAMLADADPAVWMPCARALGLSGIDAAGRRSVWSQERLEKPLKE